MTEFQFFLNLLWPFFTGALAVRVICWLVGNFAYWINKSLGD